MTEMVLVSKDELRALFEDVIERHERRRQAAEGEEVTPEGVARMLDVSVRTVRRMEGRGELPPRLGRHWRRADIVQWREARRR